MTPARFAFADPRLPQQQAQPDFPHIRDVVYHHYTLRGATEAEIDLLLEPVQPRTWTCYNKAWGQFCALATSSGLVPPRPTFQNLMEMPLWRIVGLLNRLAQIFSVHCARNAYSALLLLPSFHNLRFDLALKPLKRKWSASKPKYDSFYDVQAILGHLASAPCPTTEDDIRLRLVLLLRFLCLFRGVDIARSRRDTLKTQSQPWLMESKRKGRLYFAFYPIHSISPQACNPQFWLHSYLQLTSAFKGPELILSLPSQGQRTPLSSDRINALTTQFLHSVGLEHFSAHSTRGAAATTLLLLGVDPNVVKEMGDWRSVDTFHTFYNRMRTGLNPAQMLVPAYPLSM